MHPTISQLQAALERGETTSLALTEAALERIADPGGEGARTYTDVWPERARAAAQASDTLRSAGLARSPIDGLPISIKDLFDVAGETTRAGSAILKGAPAAPAHAVIVQRLLEAGAVILGRTNMTEFAFSGLGINPHYGTPSSPWDRATGRIPGGSSSGAGVSVADGMCVAAIGTDTGGSVRIPAAFCGITGFKPTAGRVSTQGSYPLSPTLDSIGPLGASVACCAVLDAILAGEPADPPTAIPVAQLRLAVPSSLVLDEADDHVRRSFAHALDALRETGAQIDELEIPEFAELPYINRQGGIIAAEAWAVHRALLGKDFESYDPRVASRMMRGKDISAADYIDLLETRSLWIAGVESRLRPYDALLMPTVAITAPPIEELRQSDSAYFGANGIILRNTTFINFLDGCALSIPCHEPGTAPVGLMIAGAAYDDQHILDVGLALEQALSTD